MKKITVPSAVRRGAAFECRFMYRGQRYTFYGDTKSSAERTALAEKRKLIDAYELHQLEYSGTLAQAVDDYIASHTKRRNLSPSTVEGYQKIRRLRFQSLMSMDLSRITPAIAQASIDTELQDLSVKSVSNAWALVHSAFREKTGRILPVVLPTKQKNPRNFLQPEVIPKVLNYINGHRSEVAILLGLHSLRLSEILGLRWDNVDLEHSQLHICETTLLVGSETVHRTQTKTQAGTRTIPIMIPRLLELLQTIPRDSDFVVTLTRKQIYSDSNAICNALGIPPIGCHGLRHSYASACYAAGIDAETARTIGGWADTNTMLKIYTHIAESKKVQATAALTALYTGTASTTHSGDTTSLDQSQTTD